MWIGSNGGGLHRLNPETEQFVSYFNDQENSNSLNDNFVISVLIDSKKNLWIGTSGGLNKLRPDRKTFIHYQHSPDNPDSLSDNYIWSIYEADSGDLWIGTEGGGLNILNPETEVFSVYQPDYQNNTSISALGVTSVFQDDMGRFWLTTYDGLDIYDSERTLFSKIDGLSDRNILSVYQEKSGVFWLGTRRSGLQRIDVEKNKVEVYSHDEKDPGSLSGNKVNSIYSDGDGVLWIGTDNALSRFDTQTKTFNNYPLPDGIPSENIAVNVVTGKKDADTLWLGAVNLYQFHKKTGKFTPYLFQAFENEDGLAAPWLYTLLVDRSGHVWAGGDGGLSKVNPETHTFTHYYPDRNQVNSLSDGLVQSLYQDEAGTIWVGTNSGLNKFDVVTQSFQSYFEHDGLGGDRVSGIIEDKQKNLWLINNNGLSRFNPVTGAFKNYDERDGLPRQFNTGAVFKNEQGELFFGSSQGLSYFSPEKIKDNTRTADVVLIQFYLFNQPAGINESSPTKEHIAYLDKITLTPEQSVFGFAFSSLSYWSSEKNEYAYKLEGFDQQWTYTSSKHRNVSYTNLDAGNYTFRVKASNNEGLWSETDTSIKLVILPPWWETSWFRSIMVALFALLLLLIYRWRVREITFKNQQLESKVQLRTQELSAALQAKDEFIAIMNHELRTPMSTIVGLSSLLGLEKLTNVQRDYMARLNNASRHMMQLINNILDFSDTKRTNFRLEKEPFHLNIALQSVHNLLLQKASQKDLKLLVDNQMEKSIALVGDRSKLEQILINLMGNGIKYTSEGEVVLSVSQLPNEDKSSIKLCFSVKDTGPGIPESQFEQLFEAFTQLNNRASFVQREGFGLGLLISKNLVEHMGGTLCVKSKLNVGSEFFFDLTLPLAAEAEVPELNSTLPVSLKLPAGVRVLLVEDDELSRFVGAKILHYMGATVSQANNGKNAILQLQQNVYDVVLLDLNMPDMDGLAVTRWVREHYQNPHIPIIALTAHAVESVRTQCEEAGMNGFTLKPFDYQAVYLAITQECNLSPAINEFNNLKCRIGQV